MSESSAQIKQLIQDYLNKAYFMQIGTSVDGMPWVCTVHFASDDQFHLIWISRVSTRHSLEIEKNEKVAGTVVLPFKPDEPVMGIQFQGVAKKVTNAQECASLMNVYGARFGMNKEAIGGIVQGAGDFACYVITPSSFVLFDQIHFPDNPRHEYKIVSS